MVLRADSLALSFANIVNADHQIIIEVVRGTMERLLPALQGYERQSYMVSSNYHVHVVNGRSDAYLAHHGSDDIGNTVRIPGQADHRFRRKPITHSDSSRSPIPDEPDQRFRSQADHFSAMTGIVPGVRCEGARGAG